MYLHGSDTFKYVGIRIHEKRVPYYTKVLYKIFSNFSKVSDGIEIFVYNVYGKYLVTISFQRRGLLGHPKG